MHSEGDTAAAVRRIYSQLLKAVVDRSWGSGLLFVLFLGLIVLIVYASASQDPGRATAIALLVGGASSAVGFVLGFLFGIPRTPQLVSGGQPAAGSGSSPAGASFEVNTNLEQISDWLTKIIVGVGLVQLKEVPTKLDQLGTYAARAFGPVTDDFAVAPGTMLAAILHFGIFSFLLGYLWTRLYLTSEFSRAEREARERPEYVEGVMHALLYLPPPESFEKAIQQGLDYNRRFPPNNARIWSYLACAYAQKYAYLRKAPQPDQAAMDEAKKEALEAVDFVLDIGGPQGKEMLRGLWDRPNVKPGEDDLAVFFDDSDFKQRLG